MTSEDNSKTEYPEVYKVIGAPGTGKTTRVVGNPELGLDGLFIENGQEYDLNEQMLVTYTNAGVDEAADRLEKMLNKPRYKIDDRITTIHGQCYRILGLDREQVVDHWKKKKFCDAHDLEFGWEDNSDDIMASDQKEGNALFDLYGWLQSNRMDISEWDDCPQDWDGQDDPEWLMNQWVEWKEMRDYIGFGDMIEKVLELGKRQLKNLGWGILFPNEDTTTWDMFQEARKDTRRDPSIIRGKGAFIDTKVLYVDEVQDLTPLQWEWYLLQKLACEKVYIGGDDDQCLPPNAPVEVKKSPLNNWDDPNKETQKPIKDVQVGELVRTLTGDGEYTYRPVSHVEKKEVDNKRFRTIKTESGRYTAVTDNHKMLARIPKAEYDFVTDKHYVYLMRDNENNWRIGETENLRQRLNVERGARCILPLASFDSAEKALEKETEWSLTYSIPQLTIQQRNSEVLSDPDVRDRIYSSVNPQYGEIEREFGVNLDHPPLFKKATTRGRTNSINISIKKCADMRGKKPRHLLSVHNSNEEVKKQIREYGLKGDDRFRATSTDFTEIGDLAKDLQELTGGDIITNFSPTTSRDNAVITPAGNLVEGMLVPVTEEDEVVWEEIVEINDRHETTEVYDLTVPGTHNFTTSGIGVSNTIYGWAGANPDFMLNEEGDFEVLDKTYRIPRRIWGVCDGVIQQVENRQEKEVEPEGEEGEFITMRSPSSRQVTKHLQPENMPDEDGEAMILFRARYHIDEFRDTLHEQGIPYRNMSTHDTWSDDVVKLRDALAKIDNGEGKIKGDELDVMIEYAEDHMLKSNSGVTESEKVMGQLGGISRERLDEIFSIKGGLSGSELNARNYLNATDEVNYYEKAAILGNIDSGNSDLYPDRIRIGTIHSSKGKEAPTVILATDSTNTILTNMSDELMEKGEGGVNGKQVTDAERRVYYVGMTRASEKLVLCQGINDPATSINISDLLEEQDVADDWESSDATLSTQW